jgi:hypothetical protein
VVCAVTDEQRDTLIGVGSKLVSSLPAQFLALALLNVVIVGGLFWHLGSQLDARERVLTELIKGCVKQ